MIDAAGDRGTGIVDVLGADKGIEDKNRYLVRNEQHSEDVSRDH